jgi:hypothetical protein
MGPGVGEGLAAFRKANTLNQILHVWVNIPPLRPTRQKLKRKQYQYDLRVQPHRPTPLAKKHKVVRNKQNKNTWIGD